VLRANSVERGKGAVENVVYAVVAACLLYRRDIRRLFDNADNALIACGARAINAGIDIGDVVAVGAKSQLLFKFADGVSKCAGILGAGSQNMKGQPLGILGADARQLLEFFNEPRHGLGKSRQSRLL
jgi:hypothetical protein